MRMSQELWFKVHQCRRLVNNTPDAPTAERLRIHLHELISEAKEADEHEAQLRMRGFYQELAAVPPPGLLS